MKTKDFFILAKFGAVDIMKLPKPYSVGGIKIPSDLNDITMGQLLSLLNISTDVDAVMVSCKELLNLKEKKVLKAEAAETVGFAVWVLKEVERIMKMFNKTAVPPTPEEEQAGAGKMNFGVFGLVDHYARRMGITNHEEVEKVPWIRVYACLNIDAQNVMYNRRLRNIISRKNAKRV